MMSKSWNSWSTQLMHAQKLGDRFSSEEDGYISLAGAIVKKAAEDYKDACWTLDTSFNDQACWNARKTKKEVEAFFRSEWADIVCMGNQKYIFDQIKKDYVKERDERLRLKEEHLKKMRHDVTESK